MPKKPTEPFGYAAFGKDGFVKIERFLLSDQKDEQEAEIARRLVELAAPPVGPNARFEKLQENDHDFRLTRSDGSIVTVQCTEIIFRDVALPEGVQSPLMTQREYGGALVGIDVNKLDTILIERIRHKLKKNYANPSPEFWLVIWTVERVISAHLSESWHKGQKLAPPALHHAREFLRETIFPFDKIMFFDLETNPTVVWPC